MFIDLFFKTLNIKKTLKLQKHGLFVRFIQIYERTQEMVAYTHDYCASAHRSFDSFGRWLGYCSIHLYIILADEKNK